MSINWLNIWERCKKYSFDFISKNYYNNNSKSSKFKGKIDLLFSEDENFILYWEIKFTELAIDLYTTKSWFKEKNKNFRYRENLLEYINKMCNKNYSQEERPKKISNKTIFLGSDELRFVNQWFNSKEYQSTLKNIIAIIKGNNPCGSAKNPNNSEMIWDISEEKTRFSKYKNNLIMLLDDIFYFDRRYSEIDKDDLKQFREFEISQDLHNWLDKILNENNQGSIKEEIRNYIKFINSEIENKKNTIENFSKRIKQEINETKVLFNEAKKQIKAERSRVSTITVNVFGDSDASENAHIYQIKDINYDIEKELEKMLNNFKKNSISKHSNNNIFKCYKDKISLEFDRIMKKFKLYVTDKDNLLNLTATVHRLYDKDYFYYDESGKIILLKKIKENDRILIELYKQIPKNCLSKKRKEYIRLRNNNL
ncbi:MAG4270 family putative restriction endonuclease [Mycoplasmopsis arginini]|uniref:MAG4270 family putative restriction endonuclease n=1 Tax=Mycoplasmopsis arginini TaxID=2094 RepID=UPI003D026F0A